MFSQLDEGCQPPTYAVPGDVVRVHAPQDSLLLDHKLLAQNYIFPGQVSPPTIVFIPAQGSKKKPQRFPIEQGEDMVWYWQHFLSCCRRRNPQTHSPMDLAFHVQTALQMGMLSLYSGKRSPLRPRPPEDRHLAAGLIATGQAQKLLVERPT